MTPAAQVFELFQRLALPRDEGRDTLLRALVISMIDDGISFDDTVEMLGMYWEDMEPTIQRELERQRKSMQ